MLPKIRPAAAASTAGRAEFIGLLLILIGGAVDFLTSDAYSPLLFYIPPVILVAWASPGKGGWLHVGLIALSVSVVAYLDGVAPGRLASTVYNALTLVVSVALVFWAVRRLRANMRELEAARARLETLNAEKNILFGIISHDLRGPLSVLLTFSRLIGRSGERLSIETIQKLAQEHQNAAQKVFGLLENLLEWARVQMGDAVMTARAVEVEHIAVQAVEPLLATAAQKNVALLVDEIPSALHVEAEERALATVLRNLVSNAIKFTPSGGQVRVAVHADDDEVAMIVKDTGIGMSPEKVRTLFVASNNAPSRGTSGEYGAGLGLVLCKEILARFGGRIAVQSETAKGSTFAIVIPRSPAEHTGLVPRAA